MQKQPKKRAHVWNQQRLLGLSSEQPFLLMSAVPPVACACPPELLVPRPGGRGMVEAKVREGDEAALLGI